MCLDPLTLTAVVGLAGAAVQGIGAYNTAQNNAATYNAQAEGREADAEAAKKTSAYEIARTRETVARTLGNQRAGIAANGVALSGSALDVLNDTATEGDLDVAAIRWSSDVKVNSLKYEAKQLKANAADSAASAPLAFMAPVLGGVAKFGGAFG
jgi:hypothetical protein